MARTPKDLPYKEIEKLASKGNSDKVIAEAIGESPDYFSSRKQKDPMLQVALSRGRAKGVTNVVNALYENAVVEKSVPAQIFFLKNRVKEDWTDSTKQSVEVSGPDGSPIQAIEMSKEEFKEVLKSLNESV